MKNTFFFVISFSMLVAACDPKTLEGIISTIPASAPALSNEEIISGLKEALNVGAKNAVSFTSKENGFLNNSLIRIPFPEEAIKVKQTALDLGLNTQVEKFESTLNHAAEKASAEAVTVFVNAITAMTISDAVSILKGNNNAATEYLKKTTSAELTQKFSPIVQKAIDQVNLTGYWEPLAKAYNTSTYLTGGSPINPDLKKYVTEKALQGLFHYVADEEKKIRTNPAARVTAILQKVFGSLD